MTGDWRLGSRLIRQFAPAAVVAEVGSNHDSSLDDALRMIDVAASTGCDAVKFQLFRAVDLYPRNVGVVDIAGTERDLHDVFEAAELPPEWLPRLHDHARDAGIEFLCSAFSRAATQEVAKYAPAAFKIASPELTDLPLLRSTATYERPVFLSTGMATLGEIEEALFTLTNAGAPVVTLMHCVTAYPAPPADANLAAIPTMNNAFGNAVGYSDHTTDPVAAPLIATALGAPAIEKHYTLSRARSGPDHAFALEPGELGELVAAVRSLDDVSDTDQLALVRDRLGRETVETYLGPGRKAPMPSEAALAACDRRTILADGDLPAGHVVRANDIAILRSERNLRPGLHPRYLDVVVGARLTRPVAYGQGITWLDVVTHPA